MKTSKGMVCAVFLGVCVVMGTTQVTLAQQWTTSGNNIYNSNTGNVGIGTSSPSSKLEVDGKISADILSAGTLCLPTYNATNGGRCLVFDDPANTTHWAGLMYNPPGQNNSYGNGDDVCLYTYDARDIVLYPTGGNVVVWSGKLGLGTKDPATRLDVNGTTTTTSLNVTGASTTSSLTVNGTTSTQVLTITGGADVAEKFEVAEPAKPGTVVAIDRKNPGRLCVAQGAYNHCVAGVVSGANELAAGMVLGDLPGSKTAVPVALTGRVWVQCDTSASAIEPGDLLTTAEKPGHAMAAKDLARTQGAVIGKAMTGLAKGKSGMVLVLVNLQ